MLGRESSEKLSCGFVCAVDRKIVEKRENRDILEKETECFNKS